MHFKIMLGSYRLEYIKHGAERYAHGQESLDMLSDLHSSKKGEKGIYNIRVNNNLRMVTSIYINLSPCA